MSASKLKLNNVKTLHIILHMAVKCTEARYCDWHFHCHTIHLKTVRNKIRSHAVFHWWCTRCQQICLTCGKSVVKENLTPAKTKILTVRKWKTLKVEFENSSHHGKRNFPGLNLMMRIKKGSVLCAASIQRCLIKRAGFVLKSMDHPPLDFAGNNRNWNNC